MYTRRSLLVSTCLTALLASAFMAPAAHANPEDGTITAGAATITSSGNTLNIYQQSEKAIIDWRNFDIDHGETTNFIQPGSSSITLNRVHSDHASQINGNLNANGNVVIINQNGIVFGAGAQVDVHGLVASTSDVDNNQFMNGSTVKFDLPGNTSASIVNNGTITARDAGLVGLVAPNVENNGVITANLGRVHLAAGDKATVDFYGDGLLEVEASDQLQHEIVKNTGTITADGGKIAMTAAKGGQVVSSLINAQGVIKAQSVGVRNGEIIIGGHKNVTIAGTIDASSTTGKGGKVTITGDNVRLTHTARVNASGHTGGGTVKIGGDYQGGGTTPRAKTLVVEQGAYIRNDALLNGDGGKTILWSDEFTSFAGLISGKGGAQGGDGGFAEVSGKDVLHYNGFVDLSAGDGFEFGSLLLDPSDISISSGSDTGGSFGSGTYTASAGTSVISVSTLQTQLGSASVIINSAGGTGGNGDITVANAVTWASGNNLTLNAARDVIINAGLWSSAGSGSVTLNGRDILINADIIPSGNGSLTANATRNITVSATGVARSGPGGTVMLRAAGGSTAGTGIVTINGSIITGGGTGSTFTLLSGLDGSGNRADLTLNSSNLTLSIATVASASITGFRDISVDTNLTASAGVTIIAERNLTVETGRTITGGPGGTVVLRAGGSTSANTGSLALNGTLSVGTSSVTLTSGTGTTPTQNLLLDAAHFVMQGANIGALTISGFQDVSLARAITGSATISVAATRDLSITGALASNTTTTYSLTAGRDILVDAAVSNATSATLTMLATRNLTISATGSVSSSAAGGLSLRSAGGVTTNTGIFTNNGVMSVGTAGLTLLSGLDGSGNRTDLTFAAGNTSMLSTSTGNTTITGFRDVTFDSNLTLGGGTIQAVRNLTINASKTLTIAGVTSLQAAGGNIANTGLLNLNGSLSVGVYNLTLLSGTDGSGGRNDLTLNTTNFAIGSQMGSFTVSGFRDITIDRNIPANVCGPCTVSITAERNLTINAGATLTSGTTTSATLRAAGGNIANTGIFTNNGTISVGTGNLTILSGLDGSGNRTDLTFTAGNLIMQGAHVGTPVLTGFRDIIFDRDLTFNGATTITANRNLTINAGKTLTMNAGTLTLNAANASLAGTGLLTLNGTIATSNGLVLLSGTDGSGGRNDLNFTAGNLTIVGGAIGALNITGYRDITFAASITSNNVITATAERNLTINSGVTLTTGTATSVVLKAGGGTATNTGIFTNNGTLSVGTGNLTLLSGLDGSGNRTDLTFTSGNITMLGANIGAPSLTGFRDIIFDTNLTINGNTTFTANRNLTINASKTLTANGTSNLTLNAANAAIANAGYLTIDGAVNMGTGALTLLSGTDGAGGRSDFTLTTGKLTLAGANMGNLTISGYRDIVLSRSIPSTGTINVTAERNLTVDTGVTLTSGTAATVLLKAAGNSAGNTGIFTNNGTLSVGSGNLTLLSGLDGSGNRTDLTFTTGNITMLAANIGAPVLTGFRDIIIDRNITTGASTIVANRDFIINSGATLTASGNSTFTAVRNFTVNGTAATTGAFNLVLNAANAGINNTGYLTINGNVNMGTGNLTMLSGTDGSGGRNALTLTTSNLTSIGASIGTLTITGYGDITISRSINANALTGSGILITAERNLTIDSGATLTTGATSGVMMRAAGGVATNTGTYTNNGTYSVGTGGINLVSGVDGSGNRTDITINSGNLTTLSAAMGTLMLTGFRDIIFDRDLTTSAATTVTAYRNLTINTGRTLTAQGALTLNAANNAIANAGYLTINGTINQSTANLTLLSGTDGSTGRADLNLTSANLVQAGANIGALTASGFRDVTFNNNLTATGYNIVAQRNVNINTGVTLTSTSGNSTFAAAGNAIGGTGYLTINGTLNMGTGTFTLVSGTDGAGGRSDLTLNTGNLTHAGATIGLITISGYRDIIFNRSITGGNNIIATAERHLTINAGVTLTTGASSSVVLKAAGNNVNNVGVFTNNGNLTVGNATLTLLSGVDALGDRADLVLNTSNLTPLGNIAAPSLTGFRDITFDRNINFNGVPTITAGRDFILNANVTSQFNMILTATRNMVLAAGATFQTGTGYTQAFRAANNVVAGTGTIIDNGAIFSLSSGSALTLLSGVDGSGNRPDFTATTANVVNLGASVGGIDIRGFRDITINRDLRSNYSIVLNAYRDLTIGDNVTLRSVASAGTLSSAGGVITGTGVIRVGTGASIITDTFGLTFQSGRDSSGNLLDLNVSSLGLTPLTTNIAPITITGYRDIVFDTSLTSNGTISVVAERNVTINNGVTLTSGAANSFSLRAAGNVATNTGLFTNNGTLNVGTGSLSLLSGVDGSGNRTDLTFNASNLVGTTIGATSLQGFRDIIFDRDLTVGVNAGGTTAVTAYRNIIVNSGRTLTTPGVGNITYSSANGVANGTGVITLNGAIAMGTGLLTLNTALDGSGNRPDFIKSAYNITGGGLTLNNYRDIIFDQSWASNGTVTATAMRDLIINSGVTLASGAAGTLVLKTAGDNINNTGIFVNNGTLSVGTGGTLSLGSGLDSSGNRADLTLTNANFVMQGAAFGAISMAGFRDMNINRSITSNNFINFSAQRHLTLDTGISITSASTATMQLKAAGNVINNLGILTLNDAVLNVGSGNTLTLTSGVDSLGNRVDLTLNSSNLNMLGANLGVTAISGFRDITIDRNLTFGGSSTTITAVRNLTIAAGRTVTATGSSAVTLNAANNTITGTGAVKINGNIVMGTGDLNITSGAIDELGNAVDLNLNGTNIAPSGANLGILLINGYRDITFSANMISNNRITANANRNLTVNSGVTLTSGPTNGFTLKAAAGVVTNQGSITIDGVLRNGIGNLILTAGRNSSGVAATDLIYDGTHIQAQSGNIGGSIIRGYRDVIFSANTTGSGVFDIIAERNIVINSGITVGTSAGGGISFQAAGGLLTNAGLIINNGTVNHQGTGVFLLRSGLDGTGNLQDFTWNNANYLMGTNTSSAFTLSGYRDITVAADVRIASSGVTLTAERNLTVNSGVTMVSGNTAQVSLRAAGNNIANTGILTINGTINTGPGQMVLTSGLDSSGNRADLTISDSWLVSPASDPFSMNITGFRDVTIDRNMLVGGTTAIITAQRNLTVNAGRSIAVRGGTSIFTMNAAGGSTTGTGVLTMNGSLVGDFGGGFTLLSGLATDGSRPDFTLNGQLSFIGSLGPLTISGYRDITLAQNITSARDIAITAMRNLILNAGTTFQPGNGYNIYFYAANGATSGIGRIIDNGATFNMGQNAALTLISGSDTDGSRPDFTLSTSNFVYLGTQISTMRISGFRDINLNRSLNGSWLTQFGAMRDINIADNVTLKTMGNNSTTSTLSAAGGVVTNRGVVRLGTGASIITDVNNLTIISGLDASGNAIDLNLNNANLVTSTATIGTLSISGFRDITMARDLSVSGNFNITAQRNLTVASGVTLATALSGGVRLYAAGNDVQGIGTLNVDGIVSMGRGQNDFVSGISNTTGLRNDLVFDGTHYNIQDPSHIMSVLTVRGFRDITMAQDVSATLVAGSFYNITAMRNLIINAGITLTASGDARLQAAGGVITNTGVFTNNGLVNAGNGAIVLTSGLDGAGNRVDLTIDNTHYDLANQLSGTSDITGFRDVTLATDVTTVGTYNVTAERNLTTNNGTTITANSAGSIILKAAGGVIANTGRLVHNGLIKFANGTLTLVSGMGDGGADFNWNGANIQATHSSGRYFGTTLSGFRDITFSNSFDGISSASFIAERNLTINNGVTINPGGGSSLTLAAAGNDITHTGVFTNNGTVKMGSGAFTLTSGIGAGGERADITFDNTTLQMMGTTLGTGNIAGFRDITIARDLTWTNTSSALITAERDLIVNAGTTISVKTNSALYLAAAGGDITRTGVLTLNGVLSYDGTNNTFILISGQNGLGGLDFVIDDAHFALMAGYAGHLDVKGFRDITLAKNLQNSGRLVLKANRNLTINAGITAHIDGRDSMVLSAAGGDVNGTGVLTINGMFEATGSQGTLTLLTGMDAFGNRPDLVWDNAHVGSVIGQINVSGYNNITIDKAINNFAAIVMNAYNDITLNSAITNIGNGVDRFGDITLVRGKHFVNNAGSAGLSSINGRWLVYGNTSLADTYGGIGYDFQVSGCAYGGACSLPGGNGFVYTGFVDSAVLREIYSIPETVTRQSQSPNVTQIASAGPAMATPNNMQFVTGNDGSITYMVNPTDQDAYDLTVTFSPELVERFGLNESSF